MSAPEPIIFDAADLLDMLGPIVYAYFRRAEPLYVGMSRHGLARPCDPAHGALVAAIRPDGALVVEHSDALVIWPCASEDVAVILERRLIEELRPSLNGRTPKHAGTGSV